MDILGTSPENIDRAEDRNKFSSLLDRLEIDQPDWSEARSISEARAFADRVAYPVMIRPSYVLSGAAMAVVYDAASLGAYLTRATDVNPATPVVVSKFIEGGTLGDRIRRKRLTHEDAAKLIACIALALHHASKSVSSIATLNRAIF